jgi:hypothetical protein
MAFEALMTVIMIAIIFDAKMVAEDSSKTLVSMPFSYTVFCIITTHN